MRTKTQPGQRFGRLTVGERVSQKGAKYSVYSVSCDCGGTKHVSSSNLLNGSTQSCGCIPKGHSTHGKSKTRMYRIWLGMHYRCKNEKAWVENGVAVCPEWIAYEGFYADMIGGYSDNLTIERKDVTGNYCKDNCEWITIQRQQRNKRNTVRVDLGGVFVVLKDECEKRGLSYHTVWQRIKRLGWPVERALNNG